MSDRATLAEIAAALTMGKQATAKRAAKESWPYQEEPVRGGKRRLYPLTSLPKAVRDAVIAHRFGQAEPVTSLPALPKTPALPAVAKATTGLSMPRRSVSADQATDRQKIVRNARLAILKAIARAAENYGISESRACDVWLSGIVSGSMTAHQLLWCAVANDKSGFAWTVNYEHGMPFAQAVNTSEVALYAARLSKRSLQRWIADRRAQGDNALIPGRIEKDMGVPAWAPHFLAEMQRPQKPTLAFAYRKMARALDAEGWREHTGNGRTAALEYPSLSAVARWYKDKYSRLDAQRGRNTGSALNPHKYSNVRSSDGMWPLLEVHSDGWNTKFTAPHPISGKWVTYEVWHSHDVATRKAYVHEKSIGLSESTLVIVGALYAVAAEDGEPTVWQTDNTGSVKNSRVEFDPVASIAARSGMTIVHNLPGNSQANGIAENFNKYLEECATELATFQGGKQDSLTHKRVFRLTQKMVKAYAAGDVTENRRLKEEAERQGCGIVFGSAGEAVDWIKRKVAEFNDRPHRALPKIDDPATGKRRHMTPNERMAEFVDAGWKRERLEGDELADMFRVHERKTVRRGVVKLMDQRYRHEILDDLNGTEVMVAYDLEDGNQVWVKDLAGRLICEAKFDADKRYRAWSMYEMALDKKADNAIKRLERKIDAVEAQRPGNIIEHQPDQSITAEAFAALRREQEKAAQASESVCEIAQVEAEPENVVAIPGYEPRPMFGTDPEQYRWLVRHKAQWDKADAEWLLDYTQDDDYVDLLSRYEFEKCAWTEADRERARSVINKESAAL